MTEQKVQFEQEWNLKVFKNSVPYPQENRKHDGTMLSAQLAADILKAKLDKKYPDFIWTVLVR